MFKPMRVVLDDGAKAPERAYDLDAGYDLFTPVDFVVPAGSYEYVDTGVHVELPRGTRGINRSLITREIISPDCMKELTSVINLTGS